MQPPLTHGALCLAPFRFPRDESLYVGWVGLRGAVPIVLATIPVMRGAPGAVVLFDVVFFVVLVGSMIPGATVPWVTRELKLQASLQGDKVRISGKQRDELQAAIALLRGAKLDVALQFNNFRD